MWCLVILGWKWWRRIVSLRKSINIWGCFKSRWRRWRREWWCQRTGVENWPCSSNGSFTSFLLGERRISLISDCRRIWCVAWMLLHAILILLVIISFTMVSSVLWDVSETLQNKVECLTLNISKIITSDLIAHTILYCTLLSFD